MIGQEEMILTEKPKLQPKTEYVKGQQRAMSNDTRS